MAAKLLLLILVAGTTAASLLVIRHRRIDAAYQMSRVHRQAMKRQRTLWALRWTIAERCRPEEVERLMEAVSGDWSAIAGADADTGAATPTDADVRRAAARRLVVASPPGDAP